MSWAVPVLRGVCAVARGASRSARRFRPRRLFLIIYVSRTRGGGVFLSKEEKKKKSTPPPRRGQGPPPLYMPLALLLPSALLALPLPATFVALNSSEGYTQTMQSRCTAVGNASAALSHYFAFSTSRDAAPSCSVTPPRCVRRMLRSPSTLLRRPTRDHASALLQPRCSMRSPPTVSQRPRTPCTSHMRTGLKPPLSLLAAAATAAMSTVVVPRWMRLPARLHAAEGWTPTPCMPAIPDSQTLWSSRPCFARR